MDAAGMLGKLMAAGYLNSSSKATPLNATNTIEIRAS
jgi:hypothetical protein